MRDQHTMEIHYADDYAALYVDGLLNYEGKVHNVEERAFSIGGVKQVVDDAFLGGNMNAYVTLAEVDKYVAQREDRKRHAVQLREQANDLLKQAKALEQM